MKCLIDNFEVNYPCSTACRLYGDCIAAFLEARKQNVRTNADMIRSMNDEELAEWLCSLMTADCCDQRCPARDICNLGDNGLAKWIKQPAEVK